jgi:putative nucleotidyltransferase with HDIG domain
VGYFLLVAFTLGLIFTFARSGWARFKPEVSELTLIAATLVATVALERVGVIVGEALSFVIPDVDPEAFSIFAPVAVGAIIIQAVLGTTYVTFFVLLYTTIFSLLQQDFSAKIALFVFGSIVGSIAIRGASRRSVFLVTGVRIAITNIIICIAHSILFPQIGPSSSIVTIIASAGGGLVSGVFALGLLPIIEYFGGYVTAIKLLELASLERPLLRELSMQAPGTWSHSMVMGQLCENAAEAIGARPLLTRVGAYYHDIGKTKKPLYFAENQSGKENRHDKLAPSMSALIIRAHVKDGIEMAKAARLPQALIDFIPQHHGTALIEYFYDKATKDAGPGEIIDENLFRYPGPKPQTKEAGIIMLADNVEAISRLMSDPSPAKIQGMVQKVINRVFASGQLDESELTLKDLHYIAKSFSRVLTGIVHRRVEYPESIEKSSHDKKDTTKDSEVLAAKASQTDVATVAANSTDFSSDSPKISTVKADKVEPTGSEKTAQGESKETLRRLGI